MQTASVRLLEDNDPVGGYSDPQQWPGGTGVFSVVAQFAGGTVSLEYLGPDAQTFIEIASGSLTANGGFVFDLPQVQIRAFMTGSVTNVYAVAERIPE